MSRAATPMQSRRADDLALQERPDHHVPASLPIGLPPVDERQSILDALRLRLDPRHPWAKVIEVLQDRRGQVGAIVGQPTPNRQPRCGDAVRQSSHRPSLAGPSDLNVGVFVTRRSDKGTV